VKRAAELHGLSHDHHQVLHWALELKRSESADDPAQPFLDFWHGHAGEHFRVEEEVLLPGWAQLSDSFDESMATRVLGEHLAMRAEVLRLEAGEFGLDARRALGKALERHVRFEERELFPAIEAGLDEAALAELGARLAQAEGELGQPPGGRAAGPAERTISSAGSRKSPFDRGGTNGRSDARSGRSSRPGSGAAPGGGSAPGSRSTPPKRGR